MFIKKFLALNTKSHLRKNKIVRSTTRYRKANNIGIIYTVEDKTKHMAVKSFVKELQSEGKEVSVISFMPKGKDNYEFLFDFITAKDLSIWGSIKNTTALTFASEEFDYILNVDKERNPIIENILARCKAKCRIGVYQLDNNAFYELMIHPRNGENPKDIIETIHHYTKKIGGNER